MNSIIHSLRSGVITFANGQSCVRPGRQRRIDHHYRLTDTTQDVKIYNSSDASRTKHMSLQNRGEEFN